MAFAQLVEAVPFYDGLTLEEIGGRGVRWPELASATAFPTQGAGAAPGGAPAPAAAAPATALGKRRSSPRHLPPDLGRARGRDLALAPVPRRRPAGRALAPGRGEPLARARGDRRRGAERDAAARHGRRPHRRPGGHRLPRRRPRPGLSQRVHRTDGGGRTLERTGTYFVGASTVEEEASRDRLRGRQLLRAVVGADHQGARDLCRDLRDPPADHRLRAQAARPHAGSLRPESRRPVRAAAAGRRDRQVRDQGAVPARDLGRRPVPDRAGDLDPDGRHGARDHPVRERPAHLRPARRAVRDRRLDRAAVRVRVRGDLVLRDHARRLGVRARSTRSSARCAAPRS